MWLSDVRLLQRVAYLRGVASPASSTACDSWLLRGPHLTGSQTRNVTRVFSLLTNQRTRRIVYSAFSREFASLTGNRFLSLCTRPVFYSVIMRAVRCTSDELVSPSILPLNSFMRIVLQLYDYNYAFCITITME